MIFSRQHSMPMYVLMGALLGCQVAAGSGLARISMRMVRPKGFVYSAPYRQQLVAQAAEIKRLDREVTQLRNELQEVKETVLFTSLEQSLRQQNLRAQLDEMKKRMN